jgi:hypothetical protein
MFDLHHIISDGVSSGLLVKDFMDIYAGYELEPVKLQYKDYSEWENSSEYQQKLSIEEKFWLDLLGDELPER